MLANRMTLLGTIIAALVAMPALAQKQYGPGVSDTEIKIGQTIAYSGPASAYGTLGKVEAAYFTDCILNNKTPFNDGHAGLHVVRMLEAADQSLQQKGKVISL